MNKKILKKIITLVLLAGFLCACSSEKPYKIYYPFTNQSWNRFNILRFEIPINQNEKTYDIYFSVHHTQQFEFENLNLNIVMNTPSGEERIKKYTLNLKSESGSMLGQCQNDSCINKILLKKDLLISKAGILTVEIENLTPRVETLGILGVDILLIPSKQ